MTFKEEAGDKLLLEDHKPAGVMSPDPQGRQTRDPSGAFGGELGQCP